MHMLSANENNIHIHCLIIDDNQDNSYILWRMLKSLGIPSMMASSGYEGLEYCKKRMPDVIFLDWMMPGMDGIAFMGELKQYIDHTPSIIETPSIIMCSGKYGQTEVHEAESAGARGYLAKPFTEDMLQRELEKLPLLNDIIQNAVTKPRLSMH